MKILRYREDRPLVAIMFSVFACQLALFFLVESPWLTAAGVLLLLPVQQLGRVAVHYHHHKNVFVPRALNRVYEVVLFFLTGLSPQQFTLHHCLGHHKLYLDPRVDALHWKRPDGSNMNLVEFLVVNTLDLYRFPFRLRHKYPNIFRVFARWLAVCLVLLAGFTCIDPVKSAIVFLVPMLILLVDIIRINLWQHVGVEGHDHYDASRNDLSPIYNFITFNTGYHTAHHLDASLHWSRLPELHRQVEARIPRELVMNAPSPANAPGSARKDEEASHHA